MKRKPPDHFLVFGHRGSPGAHPENTLASFRAALEQEADGFETDLRQLSDGTIVLFHDSAVGGKALITISPEEFSELVPDAAVLGDLGQIAGDGFLVLEVKEPGMEEQIIEAVAGWSGVIVCSFDHSIIETFSKRGVDFDLGLTVREYRRDLAERLPDLGANWFFPRWDVIDEDVVNVFHEAGARIVPWTANRLNQWNRLVDIGCDGAITDLPGDAIAWRREKF